MFFTMKASKVLNNNTSLDNRQMLILESVYKRKVMLRHFYIVALDCFSALILLISILIHKRSNILISLLILLILFSIVANFVAMLYYRSGYIKSSKLVTDYYGCYPTDLAKIIIKNIDKPFDGKLLPPEYYQVDFKYLTNKYIDKVKGVEPNKIP